MYEEGQLREDLNGAAFEKLVNRIYFQWAFPVKLCVTTDPLLWNGRLRQTLHIEMTVPNRELGKAHEELTLNFVYAVPSVQWSETSALNFVRFCLGQSFMHEIDESFYVDGVRVYDPHAPTERS